MIAPYAKVILDLPVALYVFRRVTFPPRLYSRVDAAVREVVNVPAPRYRIDDRSRSAAPIGIFSEWVCAVL
jgi:hypothetical protein